MRVRLLVLVRRELACMVLPPTRCRETRAVIVKVQFTLNSGMGPDTGQWNV